MTDCTLSFRDGFAVNVADSNQDSAAAVFPRLFELTSGARSMRMPGRLRDCPANVVVYIGAWSLWFSPF